MVRVVLRKKVNKTKLWGLKIQLLELPLNSASTTAPEASTVNPPTTTPSDNHAPHKHALSQVKPSHSHASNSHALPRVCTLLATATSTNNHTPLKATPTLAPPPQACPLPSHPLPNSLTDRPSHNPAFSEISLDVSLANIHSARPQLRSRRNLTSNQLGGGGFCF